MVGANPLVSRGSAGQRAGNMRDKLTGITARGGRVVVVDPRRTETASAFEHVAVRPDGDAWMLLAMLHVIFAEGLADEAAIAAPDDRRQRAAGGRGRMSARATPSAQRRAGRDVRELARDLAAAPARGRVRAHRRLPRAPRDAGRRSCSTRSTS